MQEYWELYMKVLEGKPASVLFNAGISMDIEELKFTHPTVAFIKVMLKEPNEKGLLRDDEAKEILFLEDKLEASLIKFRIGKYVGRVISDGTVTFIYYLQFTYNWKDFLEYALEDFSHYEITNGFSNDSEWNYYQNLLFPIPREWQIIQNHKVCDALKEKGDNLKIPRAIEHSAYFPNQNQDDFLKEIEKDGFKKMKDIENEDGIKGLKFFRIDKPFYYDIDELTLSLIQKAEEFGGAYDGWESSLVKK